MTNSCVYNKDYVYNTLNTDPVMKLYKAKGNRNHLVAHYCFERKKPTQPRFNVTRGLIDLRIDEYYEQGRNMGLYKRQQLKLFIASQLNNEGLAYTDEKIDECLDRYAMNAHHRVERFKRKAAFNEWTHFVTITYDSKKMNEEGFESKLLRTFSNFVTRHGWRCMGAFERSKKGRLHFHGLVYIPSTGHVGGYQLKRDYSVKDDRVGERYENTFFFEQYGRNDFEQIDSEEVALGRIETYITKYISKDETRMYYGRHIPEFIIKVIPRRYVEDYVEQDYIPRYIVMPDVFNWNRDVYHQISTQTELFIMSAA